MSHLRKVVVGIDGNPPSQAALEWVSRRVPAAGALHAIHAFLPSAELALAVLQTDWTEIRREREESLSGPWTESPRQRGCELHTTVMDDDPADALIRTAERYHADAIVVGAHGAHGIGRSFLGGVTRKLLHKSTRPTIVLNAMPNRLEPDESKPVVAGFSYGRASLHAARWAADYADAGGHPLRLLHVISPRPIFPLDAPEDMMSSYLGPEVPAEWAKAELESVKAGLLTLHPDLVIETVVDFGSTFDALTLAGSGAELVVVGKRHGNALTQAVIGPRLHHLVARGEFPTAVVPSWPPSRR